MAKKTEAHEHSVDQETAVRKIRFLIDTHHETIPGLAKGIGVLPGTIQDVLDGQSLASSALVRRIADRFQLPMDFFSAEPIADTQSEVHVDQEEKPVIRSTRAQRIESKQENSISAPSSDMDEVRRTQKAMIDLLIDKGVIQPGEWQARLRRTRLTR